MSRVQKFGDVHVVMGREAQEEVFARLFTVRRRVQRMRDLTWGGCWPLRAQKECQKMLRERWTAELPRARREANRKQKDSWYHVWCYQQFGGEGWVKIFFAFGVVDADAVEIYNVEFAEILRSKGFEPSRDRHPHPRLSARGRAARSGAPLPDVVGPRTHRSDYKQKKDLVWQTGREIAAFCQAMAGKGQGKVAAPAASRGKGKGGKRKAGGWVPGGELTRDGKWMLRGQPYTMRELKALHEDRAYSHCLLHLMIITL